MNEWVKLIIAVLSGICTAIPLVYKLIQFVREAYASKQWSVLVDYVLELMKTAEDKFEDGATRKEWVLAVVKANANKLDVEIDLEAIGNMIDSLCAMSKVVNAPKQSTEVK